MVKKTQWKRTHKSTKLKKLNCECPSNCSALFFFSKLSCTCMKICSILAVTWSVKRNRVKKFSWKFLDMQPRNLTFAETALKFIFSLIFFYNNQSWKQFKLGVYDLQGLVFVTLPRPQVCSWRKCFLNELNDCKHCEIEVWLTLVKVKERFFCSKLANEANL